MKKLQFAHLNWNESKLPFFIRNCSGIPTPSFKNLEKSGYDLAHYANLSHHTRDLDCFINTMLFPCGGPVASVVNKGFMLTSENVIIQSIKNFGKGLVSTFSIFEYVKYNLFNLLIGLYLLC